MISAGDTKGRCDWGLFPLKQVQQALPQKAERVAEAWIDNVKWHHYDLDLV